MVKVKTFVFNPFFENTFVIYETESKKAIIVDPGCHNDEERSELEAFTDNLNLEVDYLITTHAHIDHILGNRFVFDTYLPSYYLPEDDLPLYSSAPEQAKAFGVALDPLPDPQNFLNESESIRLNNTEVNFLHTPGHTPGEFCIHLPEAKICITGDVLFKDGIGRTDLWGGNMDQLIESITGKLLVLPDDTVIYPGHGPTSTIGDEKKRNPFLK